MRQILVAGRVVRRDGQTVRAERAAEPAEVTVPAVTAFAGGVHCRRMEMAANVRVPLQLHGAGCRSQVGRG